jgi:hypothetical protein
MTRRRQLGLALAAVAITTFACQSALGGARLEGGEPELRAFQRAKKPTDVLHGFFAQRFRVTDSRRIAVYQDRRGRRATLYVAKTRTQLCVVLVSSSSAGSVGGASAGCSPKSSFFQGRHVAASTGRLLSGVASNEVARIVIVGSRGVRHPVAVTRDGGFIYDCRAYNGCAGLIACVEAYSRDGDFLSGQAWGPGGCRRR